MKKRITILCMILALMLSGCRIEFINPFASEPTAEPSAAQEHTEPEAETTAAAQPPTEPAAEASTDAATEPVTQPAAGDPGTALCEMCGDWSGNTGTLNSGEYLCADCARTQDCRLCGRPFHYWEMFEGECSECNPYGGLDSSEFGTCQSCGDLTHFALMYNGICFRCDPSGESKVRYCADCGKAAPSSDEYTMHMYGLCTACYNAKPQLYCGVCGIYYNSVENGGFCTSTFACWDCGTRDHYSEELYWRHRWFCPSCRANYPKICATCGVDCTDTEVENNNGLCDSCYAFTHRQIICDECGASYEAAKSCPNTGPCSDCRELCHSWELDGGLCSDCSGPSMSYCPSCGLECYTSELDAYNMCSHCYDCQIVYGNCVLCGSIRESDYSDGLCSMCWYNHLVMCPKCYYSIIDLTGSQTSFICPGCGHPFTR